MKLTQLRALVAVVENNFKISKAAKIIHSTQPAISQQILRLEDELGYPIFERAHTQRRILGLTAEGKEMIPLITQLIDIVNTIQRRKQ